MPVLNILEDSSGVPLEDLMGRCVAVLGVRGSGKTNTATVLVEELLRHNVPLTVIDIEDEYYGLLEHHDMLVVGYSEHCHMAASPRQAPALARMSVQKGVPIILSFLEHPKAEMFGFLDAYLKTLWQEEAQLRRPYFVVTEEAHEFVPLHNTTPVTETVERMTLRGRKRGLATILVSQRSAAVRKNVLTQADAYFLHRVTHPTDTDVYRQIVAKPADWVKRFLNNAQVGQAMMMINGQWRVVTVREQDCFHAGYTPGADWVNPDLGEPALREPVAFIEAFREALGDEEAQLDPQQALVQGLAVELARAEAAIENLKGENERLRGELARASRIRVEFPEDAVFHVGRMVVASAIQGDVSSLNGFERKSNDRGSGRKPPREQLAMFGQDDDDGEEDG